MVKGSEIGDFGGPSSEHPKQWLSAQWARLLRLGAPSSPEPPGALGRRKGRTPRKPELFTTLADVLAKIVGTPSSFATSAEPALRPPSLRSGSCPACSASCFHASAASAWLDCKLAHFCAHSRFFSSKCALASSHCCRCSDISPCETTTPSSACSSRSPATFSSTCTSRGLFSSSAEAVAALSVSRNSKRLRVGWYCTRTESVCTACVGLYRVR